MRTWTSRVVWLFLGISLAPVEVGLAVSIAVHDQDIRKLERGLGSHATDGYFLLELGRAYSLRGNDSHDVNDYQAARRHLERALFYLPENREIRGWIALVTCMEAREREGATAKSTALSGLSQFDSLVAEDAAHLKIRFLRASVCMRVPRDWGRLDMAFEDLTYVEFAYRKDPAVLKPFRLEVSEVYLALGRMQLVRHEYEEAKKSLLKAAQAGTDEDSQTARRLYLKHFPRVDAGK